MMRKKKRIYLMTMARQGWWRVGFRTRNPTLQPLMFGKSEPKLPFFFQNPLVLFYFCFVGFFFT
ncbi:hypothetical protein HanHA300_Chr16g0600831 [Helianthus annuus]|nr:hypothetical protein HanHA300_Chr16g0600831 [Helianthus annuus]KAJ0459643.1 hypothetical protein HanHA89_Chr16g0651331 [Helianthus annuus]